MEFNLKKIFKNKAIIDQVNKKIRLVDTKENIIDLINNAPIPTITYSNRDYIREKICEFLKDFRDCEIVYIVLSFYNILAPKDILTADFDVGKILIVEPNPILIKSFPYMTGYEMLENFKYNLEAINLGIVRQQDNLIQITSFPEQNHESLILSEVQNEIFNSEV